MPSCPQQENGRLTAAGATLKGREHRRHWRRVLPDEEDDLDPEEDPELELLVPDDRAPDDLLDEPEDEREGARTDDEDLPDDGAPRVEGARV